MKFSMRHIALAALPMLFLATAHAQSENGNVWDKPGFQSSVAGVSKSRAQVVEELDQARAKGEISHRDNGPFLPQVVRSVTSREAVKQELAQYAASPASGYESSRDSSN